MEEQENQMNNDDLIEAALAALDQPLPTTTELEPMSEGSEQEGAGEPQQELQDWSDHPSSPTLAELDESRRPIEKTVCENCPHAVWFASPAEVKCYCRVMFLVTWSSQEPQQLTQCDGQYLGQDQ